MNWKTKFETWITMGKTKDWLLTRINFVYANYPNQFEVGEYEEILVLINTAFPE